MTPRFIVSSKAMRKLIHELNPESFDKYDDINMIGEDNRLYFGENEDYKLSIEAKENFKARLSPKQLRRFYRILSLLEDQPITVSIDDKNSNWINFNAVI
jgi:hypothetical protein